MGSAPHKLGLGSPSGIPADPTPHLAELDALRGVAILGVVLSHFSAYWISNGGGSLGLPFVGGDAREWISFGARGVALFFVLSGYLLTMTEGRRVERSMESYSLGRYAKRRALRLVPVLWFSTLVIVAVWPTSPTLWDTTSHALFLTGFDPLSLKLEENGWKVMDHVTWSLTAEVVFYCLVPLIVLRLRTLRSRLWLLGALIIASLLVRAIFTYYPGGLSHDQFVYLYNFPLTHLWLFVAGAVLRTLVERTNGGASGVFKPVLGNTLLATCVLVPLVLPVFGFELAEARTGMRMIFVDFLVVGFFASALLGASALRPILRSRPLRFLGEISYSLFLLHITVVNVAYKLVLEGSPVEKGEPLLAIWPAFITVTLVIFAASVAVSYLSYRFVEAPFMRLKPK